MTKQFCAVLTKVLAFYTSISLPVSLHVISPLPLSLPLPPLPPTPHTPVLPEPPHFLNVTQTDSSWVQIQWSESPRAEPAVSGYIVRHCLSFDCNWQYSSEIMLTHYNITRLYPSAHYQVQVMAVSPIGSGEPSSLINVSTDSGGMSCPLRECCGMFCGTTYHGML